MSLLWSGAPGLADTLDAEQLLPGMPSIVRDAQSTLELTMKECQFIGTSLDRITVGEWSGPAAATFRSTFAAMPAAWTDAAAVMANAHTALDDYRNAFLNAIDLVEQAIRTWQLGQRLTAEALEDERSAAQRQCAADDSDPFLPTPMVTILAVDPGARWRTQAEEDLAAARAMLASAGDTAAASIESLAQRAPEQPFWEGFWDVTDTVVRFPGEVVEGFLLSGWEVVDTAWEFSPANHLLRLLTEGPAAEWAHLLSIGDGLAALVGAMAEDPLAVVGALVEEAFGLSDWNDHPGRVVGRFVFAAAGLVGGGGAGLGARGGKSAADVGAAVPKLDTVPPIPVTGKLPFDRVASLFAKGDAAAPLTVAGRELGGTLNPTGSTRLYDTSHLPDAELAAEARRIATELAGGKELKPTAKEGVWNAKLEDGTTINLREISTSGVSRWTIDIINPALIERGLSKKRLEIKLQ
ncbi:hypothetical protein SAMN06295974_2386 [Plantibacter flavus]|uniref:Putative T7SS secretion signal domain-containing protein n=1 Tax=Plantibacter flavus TaxID=150123 RepID=A0A3N2BYV9_9MICO|nr:hypothetical protein [Plantibacter flavus]ROR80450.1 hypothetical protein EDD42_0491 [Plantibacter flavus]SMG34207.1 hypothetical protein SAMN06295974_2386 [Plantibacter flavus]